MAHVIVLLALSMLGFQAQAQSALASPQSKAQYCAMAKAPRQVLTLAALAESRIAFQNPYGYFSTGLCWWHSHLQRAAVYLAYYDAAAAKPTSAQAYQILSDIYFGHRVTRIPGYDSFYSFTLDNQKTATDFLSDVEILETAGGDWVHGVVGASAVTASNMKTKMDQLYETFRAQPSLIYQMLQMPGLDAHAWLVQNIVPAAGGYTVTVIDSNFPSQNYVYRYVVGNEQFSYPDDPGASFVPYTYDQNQITTFASNAASFCR